MHLTEPTSAEQGLACLARELVGSRRLLVASNRGPVEYYVSGPRDVARPAGMKRGFPKGAKPPLGNPGAWGGADPEGYRQATREGLEARPGGGGVVTVLRGAQRYVPVTWVASAMTEGDRAVAGRGPCDLEDGQLRPRFVVSPHCAFHQFYSVFSNPVLWFVQHGLGARLGRRRALEVIERAWRQGYRPVNAAFAEALSRELARSDTAPVVMVHDYQLYLVPALLRARHPGVLLHHFVHIPWPAPHHWLVLPRALRTELLAGILSSDLVGFQTARDAGNFLRTCDGLLADSVVDYDRRLVHFGGRLTRVGVYPVSIDLAEVRGFLASPAVAHYRELLRARTGERTIVRVDRLDPSKDVVGGFLAFERLLRERPEWRGAVRFLAFLVPSRDSVPEYQVYARRALRTAERVNARFGTAGWQPIAVFYEHNYPQALAAMSLYDVMVVNPVADGMNLVAKEAAIANERDGVLILSTGAGAHAQLSPGAVSVPPEDPGALAVALHRALTMSREERRWRAQFLRSAVEHEDLPRWVAAQLSDLCALRAGRLSTAGSGDRTPPPPPRSVLALS